MRDVFYRSAHHHQHEGEHALPVVILAGSVQELAAGKGKILLTRTEAAARLGISERSLANIIADNKLTPYPERPAGCARMVYFLRDDVDALKDERANDGW